eukprot:m.55045 g.55045  ORF g.55045 m.55045 type:complete len:561 (-) comp16851_c0_seq1:55-1737(-)
MLRWRMGRVWLAGLGVVLAIATTEGGTPTRCHEEDGLPSQQYPSQWNRTTNRVCAPLPSPSHVCIVGAGVAGVHMGWLLARRGYTNVTIFESEPHVGGKAWSIPRGVGGDGVARDVGGEFLSPDYYETVGLINRFNLTLLPLSSSNDTRVHLNNGTVTSSSAWYNARVANITKSRDPVANSKAVTAALAQYVAIHRSIFGAYTGRFPPQPPPASMDRIRGTALDFLARNNLTVLEPLFFNFFVMQGQGLLTEQPAWYALRWVNPGVLAAPPFDRNPDTPSAVVKEGMGSIMLKLVADGKLNVVLNTRVTAITRGADGVTVEYEPSGGGGSGGFGGGGDSGSRAKEAAAAASQGQTVCDTLVLTGPIPRFVRGSEDGATLPILRNPTAAELDLFGPMTPMQYLVTIAALEPTPTQYRAVEAWPGGFAGRWNTTAGVVVRRNIAYADTHTSGDDIGGIMSFSYWPAPVTNRSTHWAVTQKWAQEQGLAVRQVYAQLWADTYSFHYRNHADIAAGKPWRIRDEIQLLPNVRTIYCGGAANFETIEDSLYFNLDLVNRLFDSDT